MGGRFAAARGEQAGEGDTDDSFVHFVLLSVVPLWRGENVYFSHCGNDYGTNLKKQKTYGSVLVRFFCGKMRFAPFFGPSEKIRLATRTV
jgi:hypothetical protein